MLPQIILKSYVSRSEIANLPNQTVVTKHGQKIAYIIQDYPYNRRRQCGPVVRALALDIRRSRVQDPL